MSSDEKRPTNWGRVLAPIVGLIVLVLSVGIGVALSEPAFNLLRANVAGLPSNPELRYVVGGGISMIILLVFGMLYAAVSPKPDRSVSEAELDREKKERMAEELRAKKLKRDMKEKMRQRNRENK